MEVPESPAELAAAEPSERPLRAPVGFRLISAPFRRLQGVLMEGVYIGQGKADHTASIRESTAHDYLYNCLSVLDTKSSALLQYDGIILAAATLAVTLSPRPSVGNLFVIISLVLSGVSSVLCLPVIWVHWTTTHEFAEPDSEFIELLQRRNMRTLCYRTGWLIAQLAVFFLVVGVIMREA